MTIAKTLEDRMKMGKTVYTQSCAACHQTDGAGIPGAFPPLAKSDYLNADKKRAIGIVKNGLSGEITVNGSKFNSVMPSLGLSDQDIANVLTYIYSSWDNSKKVVTPEESAAVKVSATNGGEH